MVLIRSMAATLGLWSLSALAADQAAEGGLPQLDARSYPGQIFWLIVTFVVLYLFAQRVVLPRIAKILAGRSERIEGQIAEAGRLKDAAAQQLSDYEKARADARSRAQAEMHAAVNKASAEAARREEEVAKRLAAETLKAEERLAEAKAEAVRNLGSVALDATKLATQRLIGLAVGDAEAKQAVDWALMERRG